MKAGKPQKYNRMSQEYIMERYSTYAAKHLPDTMYIPNM